MCLISCLAADRRKDQQSKGGLLSAVSSSDGVVFMLEISPKALPLPGSSTWIVPSACTIQRTIAKAQPGAASCAPLREESHTVETVENPIDALARTNAVILDGQSDTGTPFWIRRIHIWPILFAVRNGAFTIRGSSSSGRQRLVALQHHFRLQQAFDRDAAFLPVRPTLQPLFRKALQDQLVPSPGGAFDYPPASVPAAARKQGRTFFYPVIESPEAPVGFPVDRRDWLEAKSAWERITEIGVRSS